MGGVAGVGCEVWRGGAEKGRQQHRRTRQRGRCDSGLLDAGMSVWDNAGVWRKGEEDSHGSDDNCSTIVRQLQLSYPMRNAVLTTGRTGMCGSC